MITAAIPHYTEEEIEAQKGLTKASGFHAILPLFYLLMKRFVIFLKNGVFFSHSFRESFILNF